MSNQNVLYGVTQVGIWPGMNKEYRRTDWVVGFMHVPSGRRDQLARSAKRITRCRRHTLSVLTE
jgi:hypothetical protein